MNHSGLDDTSGELVYDFGSRQEELFENTMISIKVRRRWATVNIHIPLPKSVL